MPKVLTMRSPSLRWDEARAAPTNAPPTIPAIGPTMASKRPGGVRARKEGDCGMVNARLARSSEVVACMGTGGALRFAPPAQPQAAR